MFCGIESIPQNIPHIQEYFMEYFQSHKILLCDAERTYNINLRPLYT